MRHHRSSDDVLRAFWDGSHSVAGATGHHGLTPALEMLMDAPYPILEHDPEQEAFIEPSKVIKPEDVPEHCVLCFFSDIMKKTIQQKQAKTVVTNRWEDGPHPIYEIEHAQQRVAFFHPGIGAALSSSLLEEAIAFGCRKFIVCGGCGVLEQDIAMGELIIVTAAVRDEGVSYHYLPPDREVASDPIAISSLKAVLRDQDISYRMGKTWTTDAPYRETRARIAKRRREGCIVVEMEAASLIAVARHRGVVLGQILYAGDDLSGESWEPRGWQKHEEVREKLFWLSIEACLRL
jgi:uridine phosphorylase